MNFKIYDDIYFKLYNLVKKEFELSEIPQPILNFSIFETHYSFFPYGSISAITSSPPSNWGEFFANGGKTSSRQELSNGGSAYDFLGQIEEEFELEISDESFEKMETFKDVLEIIIVEKYNMDIEQILELKKNQNSLSLLTFLKNNSLSIDEFKAIFLNEHFSDNYEVLEKLAFELRDTRMNISSIVSFSDVLKSDFLVTKLESICAIFYFMDLDNNKMSYFDVIDIINNGYLESCQKKIDTLYEKINDKESEIKKLNLELEKITNELDLLKNQLNYLLGDG